MKMIKYYISILIVFSVISLVNAQVIAPLGSGINGDVLEITTNENKELVVCHEIDNALKVSVWNGFFWRALSGLNIQPLFDDVNTYRRFKNIFQEKDVVYIIVEMLSSNGNISFEITEWKNGRWMIINNPLISNASSIDFITSVNGEVQMIGKFRKDGIPYNVLEVNNNEILPKGNAVARNFTNDNFKGVLNTSNQLIAVGEFTVPSQGTRTMASWNGSVWQIQDYPAFLKENSVIGLHQGVPVVLGKNLDNSIGVKKQSGNSWIDMSQGLNQIDIIEVRKFLDFNGTLYCVGKFKENYNQKTTELMAYDGLNWNPILLNQAKIMGLSSYKKALLMWGDLQTKDVTLNLGSYKDNIAAVFLRVFEDSNGNGIKDNDENYLSSVGLVEQISGAVITSGNDGQIYYEAGLRPVYFSVQDKDYFELTTPNVDFKIQNFSARGFYDVGVKRKEGVKDIAIGITDFQGLNYTKGSFKKFLVCAENKGSLNAENVILELNPSGPYGLFSSDVVPNLRDEDRIVWVINQLPAQEKFCIQVELEPLTENTFEITGFVGWEGLQDEINQDNNRTRLSYKNAPQLPNQKSTNAAFITVDTERLTYTIAFKNTTGRVLKNIRIVDQIDSQLYVLSGISYTTTHNTILDRSYKEMANGNYKYTCIWTLDNINLPTSNGDDLQSEGAITFYFDIRKDKLKEGMKICNQAKIFFEYTDGYMFEPFLTNNVCLDVLKNGNGQISTSKLESNYWINIYPNPANRFFVIDNVSKENRSFTIFNSMGQEVKIFDLKAGVSSKHSVENWSQGIYFIKSGNQIIDKIVVY